MMYKIQMRNVQTQSDSDVIKTSKYTKYDTLIRPEIFESIKKEV